MARPRKLNESDSDLNKISELEDKIRELEEIINKINNIKDTRVMGDIFDKEKIPLDDYIKVVSLCPNPLNLSTLGMGRGKIFSFKTFGEVKRILYRDLVDIIEHQDRFLKDGLFYIEDSRVIRRHGLDDIYEKILNKETIEKILNNGNDAISLYSNANNAQKVIIAELFIEKLTRGEKVDLNLVDSITRLSNIKIVEKSEEAKGYLELMKK